MSARLLPENAWQIFDTVREPLVVLDRELEITLANRAFYQLFQTEAEHIEGRRFFEIAGGEWEHLGLRELLGSALDHPGELYELECEASFGTLGRRILHLSARRIEATGPAPDWILVAIDDITQRKQAEEGLQRHAQQLEATNRELESFSYSVSHDLRAPLRAIDGFSRILVEDYGEALDDEGRRVLDVIRRNTRKMGRLIDDLLSFSRLGRREVAWAPVDMEGLARAAFDEAMALEPGRNVNLTMHALPSAVGDHAMLEQVWANLMSNGVKYTRPREHAEIRVYGARRDAELRYVVEDNGVGFDMAYAHKLFGVFQRLHGPHEFEGTGVGLALVERVVRRHGGTVRVEAEPNRGARFELSLPVHAAETMENEEQA